MHCKGLSLHASHSRESGVVADRRRVKVKDGEEPDWNWCELTRPAKTRKVVRIGSFVPCCTGCGPGYDMFSKDCQHISAPDIKTYNVMQNSVMFRNKLIGRWVL